MQLQELDDPVPAIAEQGIEAPRLHVHGSAIAREIAHQGIERQFDHHDRRSLQRFKEAGRLPDSQAITFPEPFTMPGTEAEQTRRHGTERGARPDAQIGIQRGLGFGIVHMGR